MISGLVALKVSLTVFRLCKCVLWERESKGHPDIWEYKDPVFLDCHGELVTGSHHLTSVGVLEESGELSLGYTQT